MKPFIIGVGRAGCRMANLFLTSKKPCTGILVDSEDSDVKYFPHRYKLLLGKSLVDGNGTGGDLELGKEIMEAEMYNVVERIDAIKDDMDCIFVVSALGGGTGGAVHVLAEEFKRSFTEPIYSLAILPSEEDPDKAIINFSDCFKDTMRYFDAVFPVDNDRFREGRRLRPWYNRINERIYWYFKELLNVGEYRSRDELGENVVTNSDIINTLSGICCIGMGSHKPREEGSWLSKRWEDVNKPELVVSLTEKAVKDTLITFEMKDSQKALVVVSGPKRYLDFMGSIPARLWVEKHIGGVEVRGGDIPSPGKKDLEVMVTLSGIKKSERIKYLYQLGKMLKNKGAYSEKMSRIFDKMKALDAKLFNVGEDFKLVYEDMKDLVKEPTEEEEEGEREEMPKGLVGTGEDLYPEPAKSPRG